MFEGYNLMTSVSIRRLPALGDDIFDTDLLEPHNYKLSTLRSWTPKSLVDQINITESTVAQSPMD